MTRAAAGTSSDVAHAARGACAALLAAALLCVVEFALGADGSDVPRAGAAWRLARDVLAALVVLQLGVGLAWVVARRVLPRRPATGFALLTLPLAVALTRVPFGTSLRETPGGTLALLLLCGVLVVGVVAVARCVAWIDRRASTRSTAGVLALALGVVLAGASEDGRTEASSLAVACLTVLGASFVARACLPAAGRATTRAGSLAIVVALASVVGGAFGGETSARTAPALLDGVLGLVRDFAQGGDGPTNLLRSSSALDHEVWRHGNNPPEIERDAVVAPDGTRSAERVSFPARLSTLMQDSETPARGRRFVARVWVRRLDASPDQAADAPRLAILIRAGTGGPYGQHLVQPGPEWTESVFEHAFADDAPDEGVFLRFGNDHGDPRALDVALWEARLELLPDDD